MKKQNKGITLVALVITIIILLILVAISINTLTGSGLFGRAKESKEKYSKAEAMEKVRIEVLASHDEKGDLDLEKLKKNIKENLEGATIEGDNFPVTVVLDGEEFIVKENGEVSHNGKGGKIPVTSISIELESIELKKDEKTIITAKVEPENAYNKKIEFISGNTDIVTVGEKTINEDGTISVEITAIKDGSTTIRALANDGSDIYDECQVKVYDKLKYIADASTYGDYVDYPVNIGRGPNEATHKTDWRIFYNDGTYVYLIASYYLLNSQMPSGTGMSSYSGRPYVTQWTSTPSYTLISDTVITNYQMSWNRGTSNPNIKAVSTLLNTNLWSKFANATYAEDAVGGATLEMWIESWNKKGNIGLYCNNSNNNGYFIGTTTNPNNYGITLNTSDSLYFPTTDYSTTVGASYYLAAPNANHGEDFYVVHCSGDVSNHNFTGYADYNVSVRPVVRLKSDIWGTKENGIWKLSQNII